MSAAKLQVGPRCQGGENAGAPGPLPLTSHEVARRNPSDARQLCRCGGPECSSGRRDTQAPSGRVGHPSTALQRFNWLR